MTSSALFEGTVVHQRHRPRVHRLAYRVVSALFDLDELDDLHARLRLFSHNRFNVWSFHDADHGAGRDEPLRPWIESWLAKADIDLRGGPIRVLCYPRLLGAAFNPLSVFFCDYADGTPAAILYEVNNTFGQRHSYLIPVPDGSTDVVRHSCPKEFHVSPFLPMDLTYRFRVRRPDDRSIAVAISETDADGEILRASFVGRRIALSDAALVSAFARHPLLTLKIAGGIRWEALKLWRKGIPYHPLPPRPARDVTIVPRPLFQADRP